METTPLRDSLGGLDDLNVRHGFIRKVYGILGFQLVITTGIGAVVQQVGQKWVRENPTLVMACLCLSLVVSVAMMCVFMCCPDTMRKTPLNYILLLAFTLAESVLVGFVSIQYTTESVLICLGITALVVLALTIFACQTSYDFTGMGPYLFCAVMVLCGFSFVLFLGSMLGASYQALRGMQVVYAGCGALIFSMYIVYDTQLIVGGKHAKFQFGIDDYCMAAISLYIDIIQLFLYLLQLFGQRR